MFGLDPLVVLGLTTFACGGVGWLVGPFFGSALFNVAYRGLRRQIVAVSHVRAAYLLRTWKMRYLVAT
jgi:hypothetical protein